MSNLANRIQPVIRYDRGDRVVLHWDRCACGSPLTTVSVEGRTNDVLSFETPDHADVQILPLALGSVIEEMSGWHRFQAVGVGSHDVTLHIDVEPPQRDPRSGKLRQVIRQR